MSIHSFTFAIFVSSVFVCYYAMPQRKLQNLVLLTASYLFYASWSVTLPLVLLAVTLFNFAIAIHIENNSYNRKWMWLGITGNVLCLAFFKYVHFFVPQAIDWLEYLGLSTRIGAIRILIPVGISYYIFECISYIVDVSRRQLPAVRNLPDFALCTAYFPKLIAGPIDRVRAFLPKLSQARIVTDIDLARSFTLIIVGLVRKVVIADCLFSLLPARVFVEPMHYSAMELMVWFFGYGMALYNDFAGYTDIMRGVSGLFGIELPRNFACPLLARNFTEFWNRWHITLSKWLRDYVYMPLTRALLRRNPNAGNLCNLLLPPLATMLISGLWHGVGLHLLLWGMLNGLYLVIDRVVIFYRPRVRKTSQSLWRLLVGVTLMWFFGLIAAVPFRMDFRITGEFWLALLNWEEIFFPGWRFVWCISLTLLLEFVQHPDEFIFLQWPRLVRSTLLAAAMLAIFVASRQAPPQPFVYQGF